jgi:two-component system, OmpR family, phosphate regulon response regulator PhoB
MSASILVVEDDAGIRELLDYTLKQAGYRVTAVASAEQACDAVRAARPTLVLIDWMLPGMSGIGLLQRLRSDPRTGELPIILVTAKDAEANRLTGLDNGADDYVVKPFSPRELVARVRALLRRRVPEHSDLTLTLGPLCLEPSTHLVTLAGRPIPLRLAEFRVLRFFMAHPDRVFTRGELLDRVWGDHVFVEERTVDVHIRRLRIALGSFGREFIETVRGGGYKLSLASSADAGTEQQKSPVNEHEAL